MATSPHLSAVGSAPWVTLVGYPRNSLAGKYLEGPRDAKTVKRHGYGFTTDPEKAWPFPSEKQAKAKALIVDRHMGWGEGVMVVGPLSDELKFRAPAQDEENGPELNGT